MNGAEVRRACSICDVQERYIEVLGGETWRKDSNLKDLVVDGGYSKSCFEGIECEGLDYINMLQDRKIYQYIIITGKAGKYLKSEGTERKLAMLAEN